MLLRLFRSIMPKEERFIEHFSAHANRLLAAADALARSMAAERVDQTAGFEEVSSIESEADTIARQTIVALHRAFITPFDRSDIHALITALDDAVDLMEEVVEHASLYGVTEFDPRMRELGALIQKAAAPLAETMPLLTNIPRNAERITALCQQVGRVEREADKVLRQALADLIAEKPEAISFLIRKEVYELLEAVTDRCDDVADVIEGIVLDQV